MPHAQIQALLLERDSLPTVQHNMASQDGLGSPRPGERVSSGGASPNPAALAAEARFQVEEGRWKFHTALEDELLDWKHNNPMRVEACANTLLKIFTNVLDNPDEDKYRKVKATSNAFKAVTNVRGGEHLILLAGWKPEVVEMVKYWTFFDAPPGSYKHSILVECTKLLQRGIKLIHEKAERKRLEAEEKAAAEKARLAAVKAALEEDKAERRLRSQLMGQGANSQAHASSSPAAG